MNSNTIKLVPYAVQEQLATHKNLKYRLLCLICMDAGLRVSECVTLQMKHLDFLRMEIVVRSLKKRGKKEVIRRIPMSERLVSAFEVYLKKHKDSRNPEAYLFPAGAKKSETPHLTRQSVHRRLKKYTDKTVHPHMLRHTFATKVTREKGLVVASKLLGHESIQTTEVYAHITNSEAKEAIEAIQNPKSFFQRFRERFFPSKRIHTLPVIHGRTQYHIGRKEEQLKIATALEQRTNLIIIGKQGTGKTHLLDNIKGEKILRVDDIKAVKKTLADIAVHLLKTDKTEIAKQMTGTEQADTKEVVAALMHQQEGSGELGRIVTKMSIKRLTQLLRQITERKEYTIVVDSFDGITPTGIKTFEELNDHFCIFGGAREVKLNKASFLSNFQVLKLQNLPRAEAVELILRASNRMLHSKLIENVEAYKNHIFESTQGNPQFILEMVEQYELKGFVPSETTRAVRHTTALPEIDMSIPVIVIIGCVAVLRYLFRETGEDRDAGMFIGYAAMIFLLFARYFQRGTKRTAI